MIFALAAGEIAEYGLVGILCAVGLDLSHCRIDNTTFKLLAEPISK